MLYLEDANTKFDVLIAKTTDSMKYKIAVKSKIPIVSKEWIDESASRDEISYEFEDFRVNAFIGCVVCVTGFNVQEREDIQRKVLKNGGEFQADLVKGQCTHLIAKSDVGEKYKHAKMWDLHTLSRRWIDDCDSMRVRLNEFLYDVVSGISKSNNNNNSGNPSSSLVEDFETKVINITKTKEELKQQLEDEYDDDRTPWGQHYLFSTKVFLLGFPHVDDILKPSAKNARIAHKILRAGGATVSMNPQKATHIIVNDDEECENDVNFTLRTYFRPHREKCVTFEWLKKCSQERRTLPKSGTFKIAKERFSEPPLPLVDKVDNKKSSSKQGQQQQEMMITEQNMPPKLPERSPLKVIDKDKNPLRRQPTLFNRGKKNQINEHNEADNNNNNNVSTLLQVGTEIKQQRKINGKNLLETQHQQAHNNNGKTTPFATELPETRAAVGETALYDEADDDDLNKEGYNSRNESSEQQHHLAGVKVSLYAGLNMDETNCAMGFIKLLGADFLSNANPRTKFESDFIVCPSIATKSEKKKLKALAQEIASKATSSASSFGSSVTKEEIMEKRFVSAHFFESIFLASRLLPPSESKAYQPCFESSLPDMTDIVLSASVYSEREKKTIKMLCFILGCEYTENFSRKKNTHVLVPMAEGSKYKAAMNWGKKACTKDWLEECAKMGYKVEEYLFSPPLPSTENATGGREEALAVPLEDKTVEKTMVKGKKFTSAKFTNANENDDDDRKEKEEYYNNERARRAPATGSDEIKAFMNEENQQRKKPQLEVVDEEDDYVPMPDVAIEEEEKEYAKNDNDDDYDYSYDREEGGGGKPLTTTTLPKPAVVVAAIAKNSPLPLASTSTPSTINAKSSLLMKTPRFSKGTPSSQKNIAAIPIEKIVSAMPTTSQHSKSQTTAMKSAKKSQPFTQPSPPHSHLHGDRSASLTNNDSLGTSNGKRKLPMTASNLNMTNKKLTSSFDRDAPSPLALFDNNNNNNNNNKTASPHATEPESNPLIIMNNNSLKSPAANNTHDDEFDALKDLALPNFKVGGIGATLPNTLGVIGPYGGGKRFGGEAQNMMNMETQVGYGELNMNTFLAHNNKNANNMLKRPTRGQNKALKNLIGIGGSSIDDDRFNNNNVNKEDEKDDLGEWMK